MSSVEFKYKYDNASDLPSGLDLFKKSITDDLNDIFVYVDSDIILKFFIASFVLFLIYSFIKLIFKKIIVINIPSFINYTKWESFLFSCCISIVFLLFILLAIQPLSYELESYRHYEMLMNKLVIKERYTSISRFNHLMPILPIIVFPFLELTLKFLYSEFLKKIGARR